MIKKHVRSTIIDVARLAGVSISTASLALNNKKGVSQQTRNAVLESAKKLNYYVNNSARALRSVSSKMIGLIIPDITNIFYSEIVDQVRINAEKMGYFVLLGITGNDAKNEEKFVNEFISRNVDGLILVPLIKHNPNYLYLNNLREYDIPFIFLAAAYEGINAPCVMCNLRKGSYLITKYLLDKGLRKLALIIGDIRVDIPYINGFYDAQTEIDKNGFDGRIFESDITFPSAQLTCEVVLDWKPDAIITISDLLACAAVQVAKSKGFQIPKDISITGYDDVLYSSINQTPITTVRQPIAEICQKATENLIHLINHNIVVNEELFDPTLIIRESTI